MDRVPSPLTFLESLAGYNQFLIKGDDPSANAPIRLAVIDPAYVAYTYPTTLPKVTFEGESTLSDKRYVVVGNYLPKPSDRVIMLPAGHTYVILGGLNTPPVTTIETADATATVTTSSSTYVSLTGGPSVSIDLRNGQKARITVSCQMFSDTAGANGALMSWRTTGASGTSTAQDEDGHETGINNEWTPIERDSVFVASAAGSHTFEARYRVIGPITGNFKNRRIIAEAL